MKLLSELLKGIAHQMVSDNIDSNPEIRFICTDSRKAETGCLYAAMPGTKTDGHSYINEVIEKGAVAVLCHTLPAVQKPGVSYILVTDIPEILGSICDAFFDHPSQQLKLVGTTGTNGKTTVSTLLFSLFTSMGYTCGLISTVEYKIGNDIFPSTHTTPDIVSLYRLLSEMVESGCDYCFMEVSSHAVHQRRIAGLQFAAAIFTNITHDHLDYHGTFDNYLKAKKLFFDTLPSTAFCLTNRDDHNGLVMLQNTKAARYTYALHNAADFKAKILESDFAGTLVQLNGLDIWVGLVGEFNVYNLLAVYGAAFLLTDGDAELAVRMSSLPRVNGRFEAISGPNRITAIVDYAHTPDALENVMQTINAIRKHNAKLITVVGCGGNRDAAKRPEMAKLAARMSDKIILTSDNPRDEDPETILDEMMVGVEGQHYKKVLRITDRLQAIRTAAMMAEPGDVILIAGKGHETYQEIKGVKHPFDDKKTITETFNQIG